MKNSRVLQCKQQVYDLKPIRIVLLAVYYEKTFTPTVCKYYNAFQLRFFDIVKKLQAFLWQESTRHLNKKERGDSDLKKQPMAESLNLLFTNTVNSAYSSQSSSETLTMRCAFRALFAIIRGTRSTTTTDVSSPNALGSPIPILRIRA